MSECQCAKKNGDTEGKRQAAWYGGTKGGSKGADLIVQVFSLYHQTVYFLAALQHLKGK